MLPVFVARTLVRKWCVKHQYKEEWVTGRQREARYVAVRRKLATALRKRGASLLTIGKVLNRHHTTVMSLLKGAKNGDTDV